MLSTAHQTYNTVVAILKEVEKMDESDSALFWESAKLSPSYDILIDIKQQYQMYQSIIDKLNCNITNTEPVGISFQDTVNPANSYSINPTTFLIEEYTETEASNG